MMRVGKRPPTPPPLLPNFSWRWVDWIDLSRLDRSGPLAKTTPERPLLTGLGSFDKRVYITPGTLRRGLKIMLLQRSEWYMLCDRCHNVRLFAGSGSFINKRAWMTKLPGSGVLVFFFARFFLFITLFEVVHPRRKHFDEVHLCWCEPAFYAKSHLV